VVVRIKIYRVREKESGGEESMVEWERVHKVIELRLSSNSKKYHNQKKRQKRKENEKRDDPVK